MTSRAERQTAILAEQEVFAHQLRAIEAVHHAIHGDLLDWGRWSDDRFPGCPPEFVQPRFYEFVADDEQDRDGEAVHEDKHLAINEKRSVELDVLIHEPDFVTLWRDLVYVNYVWRPIEWERPLVVLPDRGKARGIHPANYLEQLHLAMEALER